MAEKKDQTPALTLEGLAAQNKLLMEQMAQLREQNRQRAAGGEGIKVMGSVTSGQSAEQVRHFLEDPQPETLIFSRSQGQQVQIVPFRHTANPVTGEKSVIPGIIIAFRKWHGPGSELHNPEKPGTPLNIWGSADISELSEVKNGHFTAEHVLEELRKTDSFRSGGVFSVETAQRILRKQYEIQKHRIDLEQMDAEMRDSALPGQIKMGRAPAPAGVAQA